MRSSGIQPPQVSVLISVYNKRPYLAETMESILAQSFTDFEIVIVDDGSRDGSWELARKLADRDSRIRVHRHERNRGLAAAHNTGLSLARGEYLARWDADDLADPERLAKQVSYLDKHLDVDVLGTGTILIEDGKIKPDIFTPPLCHSLIVWNLLFDRGITHGTSMVRRAALAGSGGYRGDYPHVEDLDLWLRMAGLVRFANLPDLLYSYRILPQSFVRSHRLQQAEETVAIRRAFASRLLGREVPAEALRSLRDHVKEYHLLTTKQRQAVEVLLKDVFEAMRERGWLLAPEVAAVRADLERRLAELEAIPPQSQWPLKERIRAAIPRPLQMATAACRHPGVAVLRARLARKRSVSDEG